MYCKNCKTWNEDGAVFCKTCGERLHMQETPKPSVTENEDIQNKKKISRLVFVILAEVLLLLGIAGTGFFIVKNADSIERKAENYFISYVNGDWEEVYRQLDMEESDFVNQKSFQNYFKENRIGNVTEYEAEHSPDSLSEKEKQGEDFEVFIHYKLKESDIERQYPVWFTKNKAGEWKISAKDMLCNNYEISAPIGVAVTVDGVRLSDDYLQNGSAEGATYNLYTIPKVFKGTHTIELSETDRKQVLETVSIENDNASYFSDELVYTDEVLDDLAMTAVQDMKTIYTAAFHKDDWSKIQVLCVEDQDKQDEITKSYQKLCTSLADSEYHIPISIDFSNIKGTVYSGSTQVEVTFDYAVEYLFQDWWTGEWHTEMYTSTKNVFLDFERKDGKWLLEKMDDLDIYY